LAKEPIFPVQSITTVLDLCFFELYVSFWRKAYPKVATFFFSLGLISFFQ